MKYFFKKITARFIISACLLSIPVTSYAAETVCNDNGGAGFPFAVSSTTNINIPFLFGDVSEVFDINIFTDITKFYPGDLTARVTSPQGTTVELFERPGIALDEFTTGPPYGCDQNDVVVTFDDEAAVGTNIEGVCGNGVPSIGGTFLSHLPAPNNLSALDGEDPSGTWAFQMVHAEPFDSGVLNNVCITAAFAAVTFEKWVSTDNTCSDTLDVLTVSPGTNVYYCYTVSNPSTEAFVINTGAATDDQGHNISALETNYDSNGGANDSQTVVIGPIVAGGAALPDQTTTVNNAQVTASFATPNFTGDLVTVETASLTVDANPPTPPAAGVKQLYFDAINTAAPDLTRDPTNVIANTQTGDINGGATFTLNQGIPFAAPFTFSGGNNIVVQLIMQQVNVGGGNPTAQVQLFNGNSGAPIGATNAITWTTGGWQTLQIPINIGSDITLNTGDFIRVVITNTSAGNRRFQLRTLNGADKSQLQIQSNTVITVNNIEVFANPWPDMTQYSSYIPTVPPTPISIRATVSDPFGNADITGASVTIDDPTSPPSLITNAGMTSVDTPTPATRLFEYPYTLPAASTEGFWPISVTAAEGFETTVTHTEQSTMIVGPANITFSKNSNVLSDPINATNPKAIPGAIVEYTVNVVNAGYGYFNTNTFVLTDPLAASTTFFFGSPVNPITFTDGSPTSGLTFTFSGLGSATDDVDFSNDGGGSFVTPTTDANGFDTTAPPINFIRVNPKGEFKGGDTVNNPSMEIKFRVRVN